MTNEPFFTKIACPEEISMDDIRRVQNYRDQLIVVLNQTEKTTEMKYYEFTLKNKKLIEEIKKIHVWLKQTLIHQPYEFQK